MDILQKARARLMIRHPFFASMLMGMGLYEDRTIPTLATDMRKIYFNPDFVANQLGTVELVMSALAHEVLHPAMLNGVRLGGRHHVVWNMATDFVNNLVLKDSGFEIGQGWLCDDKYRGWSADQVYDDLMKHAKQMPQGGAGYDPMHGPDGDLKQPEGGGNPIEQEAIRRDLQQRVAQAANIARMAGKMPAELDRYIGELLSPQVPWRDLLREFMTRQTKDNETWAKRNRRYSDVYLPTRWSERMGGVCVVNDTSGSISPEELVKYNTEANTIFEDLNPEWIRLLWCDTRVSSAQLFEDGDTFAPKATGGGGTDMRVGVAEALKYEPEVILLFTDGYTPWPDTDLPIPLIVCCSTNADVPVGQVVRLK